MSVIKHWEQFRTWIKKPLKGNEFKIKYQSNEEAIEDRKRLDYLISIFIRKRNSSEEENNVMHFEKLKK